jgi:selenium-binding protein 1
MSAHDHSGPGYASPQAAREQPPEQLIHVASLYEGTGIDKPDFIAVVDVDRSSDTYGQVVHRTEMPNVGDELHHFGWNACSSACHSELHEQTGGGRPHEIHLPGGDCTTEIFQ